MSRCAVGDNLLGTPSMGAGHPVTLGCAVVYHDTAWKACGAPLSKGGRSWLR